MVGLVEAAVRREAKLNLIDASVEVDGNYTDRKRSEASTRTRWLPCSADRLDVARRASSAIDELDLRA